MTAGFARTSIFFKFASEGNVVERIEFHGREIAVGDLKQAIAEKKSLPKFDLVLVNEATDEIYEKDGKMLPKNMIVTVRRNPLHNSKKPPVLHVDDTDVWSRLDQAGPAKDAEDTKVAIQQRPCPPEYLCPICNDIFDEPHIARCCGRSACGPCFPQRAADGSGGGDRCPLCASRAWGEEGTAPIPNPRLADTVASLDLRYFILPMGTRKEAPPCKLEDVKIEQQAAVNPGAPAPAAGTSAVQQPAWRPCMLSPQQFLAWQQSLRGAEGCEAESSSSDSSRRKRRRGKDKSKKHSKRRRRQ